MFYCKKNFDKNFKSILTKKFFDIKTIFDYNGLVSFYDTFDYKYLNNNEIIANIDNKLLKINLTDLSKGTFEPIFHNRFRKLIRISKDNLTYYEWEILDDIGKIIGRLIFFTFKDYTCCKIFPKKGYESEFNSLKKFLIKNNFQKSAIKDLLIFVNLYEKPKYYFKPNVPLEEIIQKIFVSEFFYIKEISKKILKDSDVEYLHLYRVILRRLKSFIYEIKGYIDKESYKYFTDSVKSLLKITNKLRDIDVTLMYIHQYKQTYNELSNQLKKIDLEISNERKVVFSEIKDFIKSDNFQNILLNSINESTKLKILNKSINTSDFIKKHLKKRLDSVINHNIDKMSDEEIHSLRIEFKKLRYFIEYFNSLITNKNLLKDFGYLKKAQDFLGKNQDIFFQIEIINNFLSENTEDIIDIKKIKDILIEEKANNMVQFMKFYKKIQKLLK